MARVITIEERTYIAPDASLTLATCELECSHAIADYIWRIPEREDAEREERERTARYLNAAPCIARIHSLTRSVSNYGRKDGTYRDITKNVQTSLTLAGDRTQNGTVRHKISGTFNPVTIAYVVSDTTITDAISGKSTVRRKSGGTPLLRDTDGAVDISASVLLASLIGAKRQNR